jgi:hypothetical protein
LEATEEIKKIIEKELLAFSAEFISRRKAFLAQRKINASGSLTDSLEAELNRQAKKEAIELLLAFEEHGRFIDMKRLSPPTVWGESYINALEAWLEKSGLSQKFINEFMKKRKLRTIPKNVLNQIAWGIAKKRGYGKTRRRPWYNKSKTAAISDLFNKVASQIPIIAAEAVKSGLKS